MIEVTQGLEGTTKRNCIDVTHLDLDYVEDSTAGVDMNVVTTGLGELIEVQGTAEHGTFDRPQLDAMLEIAAEGIASLTVHQTEAFEASTSV